ncbi:MAG: twin-arginine translocation signal domain-containing protein [Daejeonella sp.]
MERRSFLKNTGISLGLLALMQNKSLAEFLADPTYKIKLLRNNVGGFF